MWIQQKYWNARRVAAAIVALSCLGMSACGGSEDETDGNAAVQEAPKVLTANKAGTACAADKDCGNGTCKKEFVMAGLLGNTTQPAPGGYCSFSCKLDADCGGGVCIGANSTGGFGFGNAAANRAQMGAGQCMLRCDSSSQCREGYRCLSGAGQALESGNATAAANAAGACQVAPATDKLAPGVVGTQCAADTECSGGQCMMSSQLTSFPGGYCTGRCLANADCGAGAECQTFGGMAGSCYRTCTSDAECGREGYRCRPNAFSMNGSKRCYPGAEPLAAGIVGKACTGDADCAGTAMGCITMNGDRTLPGGYCSAGCVEDIDCGAGAVCVGSFGGAGMGYCYKSCAAASDCREGYACQEPPRLGGGMGQMGGMAGTMSAAQKVCGLPPASDQDAGM